MISIKFFVYSDLIVLAACNVIRFRRGSGKLSQASVEESIRYYLSTYGMHSVDEDLNHYAKLFPEIKKQAEAWEREFGWKLK